MRTTLTLDDDVETRIREHVRKTGVSYKQAVNDLLRRGLLQVAAAKPAPPFKVQPLNMGPLRDGLSYDNVQELLDELDGPTRA